MPIIEFYDKESRVRKIDGLKPIDEVFEQFEGIFKEYF
jgi:adenylate kinase family enzyme